MASQPQQDDDNVEDLPLFRDCEVLWEHRRALGHGSFCSVWELKRIALRAWHIAEDGPQAHPAMRDKSRKQLAQQVNAAANARVSSDCDDDVSASSPPPRWAIKHMRDDLDEREERLVRQDLQTELHILKMLPKHPHIISLCGIGLANYDDDDDDDDAVQPVFLILGLVPSTLAQKMGQWTEQQQLLQQRQESNWTNLIRQTFVSGDDPILQARRLWKERFQVLPQLASALAHIHQHGIVFRDFKADNVGIDDQGWVKLFDFGLAKELPHNQGQKPPHDTTSTYQLTGNTGTVIYMAPEVQRNQSYGTTVDIYSLSILIHQVLSLEPCPFDPEDEVGIRRAVLDEGFRPALPDAWSEALRELLTQMWAEDSNQRPSAQTVATSLTDMLQTEGDQLSQMEAASASTPSSSSLSWTRYWTGKK
eukprot:scaffold34698_cov173-Amphora_coffeaeformis.AAC.6